VQELLYLQGVQDGMELAVGMLKLSPTPEDEG